MARFYVLGALGSKSGDFLSEAIELGVGKVD